MKIAHVLRRLSFDDWGGTEQVVWNLAKAQKAAGHEVRILATQALCMTPHETVDGLEILRFPCVYPWWPMSPRLIADLDRKGGNPFVPGLGRAMREWKPDIIHCHAMARIAELCLRTSRKIGAKCVISLHGGATNIPTVEAKSLKSPTRGLFPWGKLLDYAMRWTRRVPEDADGIVCVGEDEYANYKRHHPHVLFLPNGVDVSLFAKAGESATSSIPNHFRILCVARIDRQKNQMTLVELLARHPQATLRLVGPVTQPDYREELVSRAKELGVEDRVEFAGALSPGSPELLAEYHNADVFVLPSRHEPFGIVVLEAWAAGVPVLASNVGGLGRLCAAHPDAAVTFPSDALDSLDAFFLRLFKSPQLRENVVSAGHRAAQEYDWHTLDDKLLAFYATL
ncbi:MAG: glycosyltransferase family 4 protein [Kiritimatiellae bacterium]|nr:glycosyltransferase family 4 protein [Kiritimatiellia bacterium]